MQATCTFKYDYTAPAQVHGEPAAVMTNGVRTGGLLAFSNIVLQQNWLMINDTNVAGSTTRDCQKRISYRCKLTEETGFGDVRLEKWADIMGKIG